MAVEKPTAAERSTLDHADNYKLLHGAVRDIAAAVLCDSSGVEVAQVVVERTARLLSRSRVVAIQVLDNNQRATILAVANAPATWSGATFDIDPASVFAEAMRDPSRVARTVRDDAQRSFPWSTELDCRRTQLLCTAIKSRTGINVLLAALIDQADEASEEVDDVLHTVAQMLGAMDMGASDEATRSAMHAAIARAKQEWECTVDALPELVCVLDGHRNIVRANRAIETWSLAKVREVQGRSLHTMLHPECDGSTCALSDSLDRSWQDLLRWGAGNFELHDKLLGRVLNVTLRTMSADADDDPKPSANLAVIVLSDITKLHDIQADLQSMNEQLETRIAERTRELNASHDELSLLSDQLMTTQESERKRIAQELHDSIGQSLSAIKYSLERAVEMTNRKDASAPRPLLITTIARVQETLDSIRSIAMNLRPSMLDDLGAVSAVRWCCREFSEVYAPIKVHTDFTITDRGIPERLGTPIFRTVQESLNNIAKHAQAKNVFVSMRRDLAKLTLEIRDDGVGFDAKEVGTSASSGHGLRGLRERAAKTGGTFSLQSKRRAGTVVRVGWPLERVAAPAGTATQKAFTLLELLVVMVIIGILAGFVAPRYFAQVGKSQVKAAHAQIDALDKALDQYRIDMGRYPSTEEGLDALTNAPANEPAWTGPYLKKAVPLDPWGHPYVFASPGTHTDVDIISYGKDGQPGGTGENADVTNW